MEEVFGKRMARSRRLVGFSRACTTRVCVRRRRSRWRCWLPRTGCGRLILRRTRPQAGKRWTDTIEFHDERGLKKRPPGETRVVRLPPHLVAMWREHVATFGTADDGRLFALSRAGRQLLHLPPRLAREPRPCPVSSAHHHAAREAAVRPAALGAVPGPGRGRPVGWQQASRSPCPGTRGGCTTARPSTTSASRAC
jgi:hypothetical protein